MHAENLSKRENVSDLISMRMILNDSLSTFNDVSKSRTHVALLWASQANTLPATFWSLLYMIRYVCLTVVSEGSTSRENNGTYWLPFMFAGVQMR